MISSVNEINEDMSILKVDQSQEAKEWPSINQLSSKEELVRGHLTFVYSVYGNIRI